MKKLFVIAGHGAGDPGAVGNGYTEAERVRALAKRIKHFGGDSVMLGDPDRNYYADSGISSLELSGDWCIIELHMDSAIPSARGGHVIIKAGLNPDQYDNALAGFIGGILPGRSGLIIGRSDLANPNLAAARGLNYRLVECGFITNAEDINIFNTKMDDIAKGILSCFGIQVYTAMWVYDKTGWWYRYADGSYPRSQWLLLDSYYYFDDKGYALSNEWLDYKGNWYWLKDDCRMATGWQKISGHWYYLNPTGTKNKPVGAMLTGWQLIDGNWYYLREKPEEKHPQGSMAEGEATINGQDYYFTETSADKSKPVGGMMTGWRKKVEADQTKWFFYNKDNNCQPAGSMLKNHWLTMPDGKKYYLKDDGAAACEETVVISGKKYKFDKDCALCNS